MTEEERSYAETINRHLEAGKRVFVLKREGKKTIIQAFKKNDKALYPFITITMGHDPWVEVTEPIEIKKFPGFPGARQ
jgi:rRNA pseudouridine-1189 N-methylase Emg1 (Nep1/Mra1 family)